MSEEMELQDPMEEPIEPAAETEESAPSIETEASDTAPETTTEPEKKDGVQSRIDELTFKRREAERERDYWRDAALKQAPPEQQTQAPVQPTTYPDLPEPRSEDFDTYDQFVDARADYRAELKVRHLMETQQTQTVEQQKRSWNDQGRSKYQDWDTVFNHSGVQVTEAMGQAIIGSSQSHDMAYYLGKNPQEAQRIATLSPIAQVYELGKLEARLAGPPQKTKTNAPTPTQPVGGKEVPQKTPDSMSYEEYRNWRSQGGGK